MPSSPSFPRDLSGEARRREYFKEERPLQPSPHHIFLADTRHHVGVSSPDRIELVKLGWTEGLLI